MGTKKIKTFYLILAVGVGLSFIAWNSQAARQERGKVKGTEATQSQIAKDALKTYVPPGDFDKYYAFLSGGHSGNVYVYGLPSMRHIRTIPVFSRYSATGWGYDEASKKLMGDRFTWGDIHHPALSETKGDYDGRWLFVNDNAHARLARIDLKSFRAEQILGPVPNVSGDHASAYVTWNSEYAMMGSRFSTPIPFGTYAPVEEYKSKYKGVLAFIHIDPKSGHMDLKESFQILMPPWNFDLADGGKGPSGDWAFFTCYNSEAEFIKGRALEVTASQRDKDYIVAVHWKAAEKAVKEGKYTMIDGMKVIDPTKVKGLVYGMYQKKSPHGVDVTPDGRYIIGNGKLEPVTVVHSFEKMLNAIKNNQIATVDMGIPILKEKETKVAEVAVGLGPLHTTFDDKGYAYTSLFVESAVAKWGWADGNKDQWKMVDKVPVQYNIGHIASPHGLTMHPKGEWIMSLNKLSKGTHIKVGPDEPESCQLIDLSGPKMRIIYQAFTEPEPHYGQIIEASLIEPNTFEVFTPKTNPEEKFAVYKPEDAKVVRKGNTVEVFACEIRSSIYPNVVEVNEGDRVIFHLTNMETMRDELHGFGICQYDVNGVPCPGETMTFNFTADKPGVWPYYCTNFCSALHQEMQGYLLVKPKK
jgi:nitrous-oxide reductase